MAVTWTIKGESGAGWNATERALEYYGIGSGSVTTGSLDQDKAALTAALGAFDGTTFARPTNGQKVQLLRNGATYFSGWVIDPTISAGDAFAPRLQVNVVGPWWWLRKTPVASTRAPAGYVASATRAQMVFPAGSLASAVTAIVMAYNAAVDTAIEIAYGSVAASYTLPIQSISGGDYLSAIAEMLRLVPDATAYWAYSTGAPALHVARRGAATTRTITAGVDCQGASLNSRSDLANSQGVVIHYAEMVDDQSANTGRPRYMSQSYGATGAAQRLTVSGPEIDTFLPDSPVESVAITTVAPNAYLRRKDPQLSQIYNILNWTGFSSSTGAYVAAEPSNPLPSGTLYEVTAGDQKDWFAELGSGLDPKITRAVYSATYYWQAYGVNLSQSGTYPWGYYQKEAGVNAQGYMTYTQTALTRTTWEFFKIANVATEVVDAAPGTSIYQAATLYTASYQASAEILVSNVLWTNKILYRRPQYTFISPPAGLAQNLDAAQSWTPWEGEAVVMTDTPGAVTYAGCKINVANMLPEWSTMGALVIGHQVDLFSGKETIQVGVPPRLSALNLAQKLRTDAQNNITFV